jgi:hypothetical protein
LTDRVKALGPLHWNGSSSAEIAACAATAEEELVHA